MLRRFSTCTVPLMSAPRNASQTVPGMPERASTLYDFLGKEMAVLLHDPAFKCTFQDPHVGPWATVLDIGLPSLQKWRGAVGAHMQRIKAGELEDRDDHGLMRCCAERLSCIVSPFLRLARQELPGETRGTTFFARCDLPAGCFLLSVPEGSVMRSDAPLGGIDPIDDFVIALEDLAAKLLQAVVDPASPWHGYATYLREFYADPPRNLPYLQEADVQSPLARELVARMQSLASKPQNLLLRGVRESDYRWACGTVLARRCASVMLCPLMDKLNHSATPNAYYTMATQSNMCGVDVVDNLMSGVPEKDLYAPYLHVFTLCPVARGHAITLSYSDADPNDLEGSDIWKLTWGVSAHATKTTLSEAALKDLAARMTRQRIDNRKQLFP